MFLIFVTGLLLLCKQQTNIVEPQDWSLNRGGHLIEVKVKEFEWGLDKNLWLLREVPINYT